MSPAATSSVLRPASEQAALQSEVAWVLIAGAALVFAVMMGLLLAVLRRRAAPRSDDARIERIERMSGDDARSDSVPSDDRRSDAVPSDTARGDRLWILLGGVLFPALVLAALLGYGSLRGVQLRPTNDADALVVAVVGHQWWWEVRYRDPAGGADIVLANEIRVPRGRRITLGLASADVIHSFWVPELGGKLDMLPGKVQQLQFVASHVGAYRGVCAEFCGIQHARMALQVVVQEPAEFERWLAGQALPARAPQGAFALRGQAVFAAQRCNACHRVRGAAGGSDRAPDLSHVASRLTLGAGVLTMNAGSLAAWVADVQAVKPGARMPSYKHLDGESLQALAAYLGGLE